MKRLSYLIIGGIVLGWWTCAASAQTLTIGTAEWRPWQIVEDGHLTGITSDILQEIAKRTGYTMNIRPLPHKRLMSEFEMMKVDMEPTVNPAWRDFQQDISVYSTPYYTTGDIILVRKESGIVGTSARDFKGMTLGCGLGYYYPEGFQESFEKGEIIREDNPVSEKNLVKLALKRIDGMIVDKIQAKYSLKKNNMNPSNFVIAYEFKPSNVSLRLHRRRADHLPVLNAAIEQMKTDGTIERIVAKYIE